MIKKNRNGYVFLKLKADKRPPLNEIHIYLFYFIICKILYSTLKCLPPSLLAMLYRDGDTVAGRSILIQVKIVFWTKFN